MEALRFLTILICSMLPILSLLHFSWAAHIENITQIQSLKDDGNKTTLFSPGQIFEFGFSPRNSKNRFLGIWYKRKPEAVVCIPNRNNPLTDSNGKFTIKEGKLVLLNSTRSIIFFNVSNNIVANNPVAQLLDSGNLVLQGQESMNRDVYIWQSFDYPTDTRLAGMKPEWDLNTGFERYLTSWRRADGPSTGDVTCRISIVNGLSQLVLAVGLTRKLFRTGIWNGARFSGIKAQFQTVYKILFVFNEMDAHIMFENAVEYVIQILKLNHSKETSYIRPKDSL